MTSFRSCTAGTWWATHVTHPRGRENTNPGRSPSRCARPSATSAWRRRARGHAQHPGHRRIHGSQRHPPTRTPWALRDTLDARLAQARDGTLGHLDFLQVLCEDEITRRESAALTRRIRRARFEEQSTFESFDFSANTKLPAARLRDLAALRWLDAAESVILYRPVGVGKTHMAQALGHAVARRGADVRFAKTSRVLSDLAGGHADRTWGSAHP